MNGVHERALAYSAVLAMNTRFAVSPTILVVAASKLPLIGPPKNGTILIKLIKPLDPAFVTSLKPTA
jgi:hypothetical protein